MEPTPDPAPELPELPVPGDIHKYKAPLYWTIYEYAREMELAGIPYDQMDLSSDQWDAVIDMMATKFKPLWLQHDLHRRISSSEGKRRRHLYVALWFDAP